MTVLSYCTLWRYLFRLVFVAVTNSGPQMCLLLKFVNRHYEIWGSHSVIGEDSSLPASDAVSMCRWFRRFEGSCCFQLEGSSSRRREDCLKHSSDSRLLEALLWEQTAWSTPLAADCLKHSSESRLLEALLWEQTAWSTPLTADCLKHSSDSRLLEALLWQQTAWSTPLTADCLKHSSDSRLLEALLQRRGVSSQKIWIPKQA